MFTDNKWSSEIEIKYLFANYVLYTRILQFHDQAIIFLTFAIWILECIYLKKTKKNYQNKLLTFAIWILEGIYLKQTKKRYQNKLLLMTQNNLTF